MRGKMRHANLKPKKFSDRLTPRKLTCRSVSVRAQSADNESRSVETVLATQNVVAVFDMESFRVIDEVLLMSGAEVPDYLPLLNNHWRFDVRDVMGSVREIRVEGGSMVGRLYFAEGTPDSLEETSWRKVRAGHVRDVSIGYRTLEYTDIQPGQSAQVAGKTWKAGERILRITTKWKPFENSLTPVGADDAAKIRAAAPPPQRKRKGKRSMTQSKKPISSGTVAKRLRQAIRSQADGDLTSDQIIGEMAACAGIRRADALAIVNGKKRGKPGELAAFAAVLGLPVRKLTRVEVEQEDDAERDDLPGNEPDDETRDNLPMGDDDEERDDLPMGDDDEERDNLPMGDDEERDVVVVGEDDDDEDEDEEPDGDEPL